MKRKAHVTKRIAVITLCMALVIPTPMAMAGEPSLDEQVSLADYETFLSEEPLAVRSENEKALNYMETALPNDELNDILQDYQLSTDSKEEAYEHFKGNVGRIYAEVQANGFDKEQAAALFRSAAAGETGNAELTEFTPVEPGTLPPPPHGEDVVSEGDGSIDASMDLLGDNDMSTRYENTGVGYEAQSVPGYTMTTTYFYPGECNIDRAGQSGIAAYMFYSLINYDPNTPSKNGTQDLGVVYSEGYWQPVVYGKWQSWATSSVKLDEGGKYYFKIWVDEDSKIHFQGLNGNNFNDVVFYSVYSSWGELPTNGYSIKFTRQITYAANEDYRYSNAGYYLEHAKFDQAYLYNGPSVTERYQDSNIERYRCGKFGCPWAGADHVKIHSNTHWSSEDVSIYMNY